MKAKSILFVVLIWMALLGTMAYKAYTGYQNFASIMPQFNEITITNQ